MAGGIDGGREGVGEGTRSKCDVYVPQPPLSPVRRVCCLKRAFQITQQAQYQNRLTDIDQETVEWSKVIRDAMSMDPSRSCGVRRSERRLEDQRFKLEG